MARPTGAEASSSDRRQSLTLSTIPDINVTFEEFQRLYNQNPRDLYEYVREAIYGLDDTVGNLDHRLLDSEMGKQRAEGELITAQQERDRAAEDKNAYANQIPQMTLEHPRAGATTIPAKKSAKIPDPPALVDGKEPRFEDWLLLISQKLSANNNHFDTPALRIAYVASRCEGKARRHITPRLRSDTVHPYTDSTDMLKHLETIYSDPNRVDTAKNQFRQLYIKTSDHFDDFFSEFMYLAAEAGVHEDDLKHELYHRITT